MQRAFVTGQFRSPPRRRPTMSHHLYTFHTWCTLVRCPDHSGFDFHQPGHSCNPQVNTGVNSEHELFLRLFITNGGGW